jgi:hypothetical protein
MRNAFFPPHEKRKKKERKNCVLEKKCLVFIYLRTIVIEAQLFLILDNAVTATPISRVGTTNLPETF